MDTETGVDISGLLTPVLPSTINRIHALLDSLLEKGLYAKIWLETRTDLVDRELLKKMKRAGVHTVAYGLESTSQQVLSV